MLRILSCIIVVISLLSPILGGGEVFASPQVIMVVIDRLALEDITRNDLPNIKVLAERGAIGLMNVRSGGRQVPEDTYTSIGASYRAIGSKEAGLAFDVNALYEGSLVRSVYEGRTGFIPQSTGIVNLGITQTIKENQALPQSIYVGALGDAIRKAGKRTGVLGNSDKGKEVGRYGASIAMDSKGYVDIGIIDDTLILKDPYAPYGTRIDVKGILTELQEIKEKADFIVVELGDLFRLEEESYAFSDEMIEKNRARALGDLDDFVEGLFSIFDNELDDTTIIFLSPTPSLNPIKRGSQLTPMIVIGNNVKKGLLTSPGTRWDGLVTNISVAPTVLYYLDIPSPGYINALPVQIVHSSDPIGTLEEMDLKIEWANAYRSILLRTYILIAIILHIGSLILLLVPIKAFQSLFSKGLLFLISLPISLLFLPLWPPQGLLLTIIIPMLIALLLSSISPFIGNPLFSGSKGNESYNLKSMVIIMMVTAILLMIDIATGYRLIRYSPLGYDPVTGARFYGIGNEYMGILVGSALVGTLGLLQLLKLRRSLFRFIMGFVSLIVTAIIGHPSLGANAGGTITSIAGFGIAWLLLEVASITIWHVLGLLITIIGILGAIAIGDYLRGSTSHIGGAIKSFVTSGTEEIYNIIVRKVSMNIKLFRWSPWSRALLVALGALGLLFYRPTDLLKRIVKRYPILAKGLLATIIASIVAAAVNDSGVVAAATCILYASSTLLVLALEDRKHQ